MTIELIDLIHMPNILGTDRTAMKLLYFAPADIQLARVDRQCIVYFCEALHRLGVDVELVAMGIRLTKQEVRAPHTLDLYRIRDRFPVQIIRVPVHQKSRDFYWSVNRLVAHTIAMLKYVCSRQNGVPMILYTKNYLSACVIDVLRKFLRSPSRLVFEIHTLPQGKFQRLILERVDAIVANSYALARDLARKGYSCQNKVIGTHQGIDLELYELQRVSKEEARKKLQLPMEKKLIVYTGKIYIGYKEVEYLIEVAKQLREDVCVVMVGGRADPADYYRKLVDEKNLQHPFHWLRAA